MMGEQQQTEQPQELVGMIKSLKGQYGFIRCAAIPRDVFFHASSIAATAEALAADNVCGARRGRGRITVACLIWGPCAGWQGPNWIHGFWYHMTITLKTLGFA